MTKAEKDHMERVAAPAEIHHLRRNPVTGERLGMSQRASNFHVIPLCPKCHRTGGEGVAYHAGPRTWEAMNGTEVALWKLVQTLIGEAA